MCVRVCVFGIRHAQLLVYVCVCAQEIKSNQSLVLIYRHLGLPLQGYDRTHTAGWIEEKDSLHTSNSLKASLDLTACEQGSWHEF